MSDTIAALRPPQGYDVPGTPGLTLQHHAAHDDQGDAEIND
jgi:hypothetical protein